MTIETGIIFERKVGPVKKRKKATPETPYEKLSEDEKVLVRIGAATLKYLPHLFVLTTSLYLLQQNSKLRDQRIDQDPRLLNPEPAASEIIPTVFAEMETPTPPCENPAWPASICRWAPYIDRWADQYSVPRDLVAAVMLPESYFDPDTYPEGYIRCDEPNGMNCVSKSGAIGPMQVMPRELGHPEHFTARELRKEPDKNFGNGVHQLATNVLWAYKDIGVASELDAYKWATAAYYAGQTGALSGRGFDYANLVVSIYKELLKARVDY